MLLAHCNCSCRCVACVVRGSEPIWWLQLLEDLGLKPEQVPVDSPLHLLIGDCLFADQNRCFAELLRAPERLQTLLSPNLKAVSREARKLLQSLSMWWRPAELPAGLSDSKQAAVLLHCAMNTPPGEPG